MDTIFDAYVSFPATSEYDAQTLDRLHHLLGSVEQIEIDFEIELSCGDGKFLRDIEDDDAELAKYDGNVCYLSPPRFVDTGEVFKLNKDYRFTVKNKEYGSDTECRFYINGRERSRRLVH